MLLRVTTPLGGIRLGILRRKLAINQAVKQSRRFVCHSFEIVSNAGQRYLYAIANDWIVIDAQHRDLLGDLNFGFDAGIDDIRGDAVVVAENSEGIAQRPNRMDHPSPA